YMIPTTPRSTPFPYTTLFRSTVLTITLTNPGRQPLRWSNPLGAGGEWSGLRLVFSKKGADDEVARDLTGDDLQAEPPISGPALRSEEHTSELQSRENLVCRLL